MSYFEPDDLQRCSFGDHLTDRYLLHLNQLTICDECAKKEEESDVKGEVIDYTDRAKGSKEPIQFFWQL